MILAINLLRALLVVLIGRFTSGLRVAMDMQKEITARRKQVDSLQSKIKHLEETIDQLYQVNKQRTSVSASSFASHSFFYYYYYYY